MLMFYYPCFLFALGVFLVASCTPLQREAWRAGQAGKPFPSARTPQQLRTTQSTTQNATRPYDPSASYRPALGSVSDLQPLGGPAVIESNIEGDFEGWEGETVFKLTNGQIWQQVDYAYSYHYAFRPSVLIYQSRSGGWKMKVDGVDHVVGVERLR